MKTLIGLISLAVMGTVGTGYLAGMNESERNGVAPLAWPMDRGEEREKKLTFGLFVTPDPEENPIDPPERFTGYHTALDFEIFEEEENTDVAVKVSCDGKILQQETIAGYGGVVIQSCQIPEEVTVLYGHLDFERFQKKVGDEVKRGELLGYLGAEKSAETGNTRKHLHFGVHEGPDIEVRGYVQNESELESFRDPLLLLEYSN